MQILTRHPEMEFIQLQINYLDWDSEWIQSQKCYEVALKHGKQVIVMEPVKGGTLVAVPESVVNMFKSHNLEQLNDNTAYMSDFSQLSDEEKGILFETARAGIWYTPNIAMYKCMINAPKVVGAL